MIRRHGHYIVEKNWAKNSSAHCLKCPSQMQTPHGRASLMWIFDIPCRGEWKETLDMINVGFSELRKEMSLVRRWMAFDKKLARKKRRG